MKKILFGALITTYSLFALNLDIEDDFYKMHKEMNSLMQKYEKQFFNRAISLSSFTLDITDIGTGYVVKVDMPGRSDRNLHLKRVKDVLIIKVDAEKPKRKKSDEKHIVLKKERFLGSIKRVIELPSDAGKKFETTLEDGVLTIKIPKKRVKK